LKNGSKRITIKYDINKPNNTHTSFSLPGGELDNYKFFIIIKIVLKKQNRSPLLGGDLGVGRRYSIALKYGDFNSKQKAEGPLPITDLLTGNME